MRPLSEEEKNLILETTGTKGWALIVDMIDEAVTSLRLAKNVNKKREWQDVAVHALAKAYAATRMERVIKEISGIKREKKVEPKNFV